MADSKRGQETSAPETTNKRRKVASACLFCKRSHMVCANERPCERCIKRGIAHLCVDDANNSSSGPAAPDTSKTAAAASTKRSDSGDSSNNARQRVTSSSSASDTGRQRSRVDEAPASSSSKGSATAVMAPSFASSPSATAPTSEYGLFASSPNLPAFPLGTAAATSSASGQGQTNSNGYHQSNKPADQAGASLAASSLTWPVLDELAFTANGSTEQAALTDNRSNAHNMTLDTEEGLSNVFDQEWGSLSAFLDSLDVDPSTFPSTFSRFPSRAPSRVQSRMTSPAPQMSSFRRGPESNDGFLSPLPFTTTSSNAFETPASPMRHWLPPTHAAAQHQQHHPLHAPGSPSANQHHPIPQPLPPNPQPPALRAPPQQAFQAILQAKFESTQLASAEQGWDWEGGWAMLDAWMDAHASAASRARIRAPLAIFRPTVRQILASQSKEDSVLVEEGFQRMLLQYDRVFCVVKTPSCLWRRTGEIVKANAEFARLVDVDQEWLRDGKVGIYELMKEESAVNFWEQYFQVGFDKSRKAVLTTCTLLTPKRLLAPPPSALAWAGGAAGGRRLGKYKPQPVSCCFSFTVQRDGWGVPMGVCGAFLRISM